MLAAAALPNTANTVTLAADPVHRHIVDTLTWSYSGVPTGGGIQVTDAGVITFDLDISVAGLNSVAFRNGLASAAMGNPVNVTLAAGGVGITGKLNIEWHDDNS